MKTDTKYIVIGPHCFGEGPTLAKAKRQAKDRRPGWLDNRKVRYVAYETPPSCRVTELGKLAWLPSEGKPKLIGQV